MIFFSSSSFFRINFQGRQKLFKANRVILHGFSELSRYVGDFKKDSFELMHACHITTHNIKIAVLCSTRVELYLVIGVFQIHCGKKNNFYEAQMIVQNYLRFRINQIVNIRLLIFLWMNLIRKFESRAHFYSLVSFD